jgi:biopolymer transport protein ExbD
MRFRDIEEQADEDMQLNLTPLIDCVFLLLIFFLLATTFIKLEQDLEINLPQQSRIKVRTPPARPIVVNVRYLAGGNAFYHVENERLSLPALTVNLSRARVRNPDQSVVIRGDRRVRWEHIAAVMGCCAQAGISRVSATVEIAEQG